MNEQAGGVEPRRLRRTYTLTLVLLALFIVVSQFVVQLRASQRARDLERINFAGRQRMFSQRVAQLAHRLAGGEDTRRLLNTTIDTWNSEFKGLKEADDWAALTARAQASDLHAHHEALENAVRVLIADAHAPVLGTINAEADAYLARMERVVETINTSSSERMLNMRVIEVSLLLAAFFVLWWQTRKVFLPSVERLEGIITFAQRARQDAEAAVRTKSELLANMSHELRTPLNAVVGMSSLLKDTRLSAEQREYVETVQLGSDTLLDIINDILDFSKIESGKVELERLGFDVRECIESALDLLSSRAAEKALDLVYLMEEGVPAWLTGDVTRLRQVLVNLLSNAVKFTDHGDIFLRVATTDKVGIYEFSVRDTGIGIASDRVERLFQSFSQVDASTTRKYGGTGLGLAISRRLVELMGGHMRVESEPGKGSTFLFTIAAATSPHAPKTNLRGSVPELSGRRALFVDDNATNRNIVQRQLEAWGFFVETVATPQEGLLRLGSEVRYDVVLSDYQMPEMNGVDFARAARAKKLGTPFVLLSSLGRSNAEFGDDHVLFSRILSKPVKPSQLFDALLSLFVKNAAPEERALAPDFAERFRTIASMRVLVAEDNPVNQKVARAILERLGALPLIVANGYEALSAIEAQRFDVFLLDVQMPELDGLETARRICARYPSGERPFMIAMTAEALKGDREKCLAAGMNDYVSKPISAERLAHALIAAVEKGGATVGASPTFEADADLDKQQIEALRALDEPGNPDGVFRSVAIVFLDTMADTLFRMEQAAERNDISALRALAHMLKGSSAQIGASKLATSCRQIELLDDQCSANAISVLMEHTVATAERTRAALEIEASKG